MAPIQPDYFVEVSMSFVEAAQLVSSESAEQARGYLKTIIIGLSVIRCTADWRLSAFEAAFCSSWSRTISSRAFWFSASNSAMRRLLLVN